MQEQTKAASSVIRDLDYDSDRKKLYVTFVSGKMYVYDGVPPRTFEELAAAPSKGKFFNRHIKDRYPFASATSWPAGLRH